MLGYIFLAFIISAAIIYNMRRMYRLSAQQCVITYFPRGDIRVLSNGVYVLFPFIESPYSIKWTVSRMDEEDTHYLHRKSSTVIDLSKRSYVIPEVRGKTKDGAIVTAAASFLYRVSETGLERLMDVKDPPLSAAQLCTQCVAAQFSNHTLEQLHTDWRDISKSILDQLRATASKQNLCLNITAVSILHIKHTPRLGKLYAMRILLNDLCKDLKQLKQQYPDISDVALAELMLECSNIEENERGRLHFCGTA